MSEELEELDYEFIHTENSNEDKNKSLEGTSKRICPAWRLLKKNKHDSINKAFSNKRQKIIIHNTAHYDLIKKKIETSSDTKVSDFSITVNIDEENHTKSVSTLQADETEDENIQIVIENDIPEAVEKDEFSDFSVTMPQNIGKDVAIETIQNTTLFNDICTNFLLSKVCEIPKCSLLHKIPVGFQKRVNTAQLKTIVETYNWIRHRKILSTIFPFYLKYFLAYGDSKLLLTALEDVSDDVNAHFISDIIDGLIHSSDLSGFAAVNLVIENIRPIGKANDHLFDYIIKQNFVTEDNIKKLIELRQDSLPISTVAALISSVILYHSSNSKLAVLIKQKIVDLIEEDVLRRKIPKFCLDKFFKITS